MEYVDQVLAAVKAKNANEPEFLQTATEVLGSLRPVLARHPEYQKARILERLGGARAYHYLPGALDRR